MEIVKTVGAYRKKDSEVSNIKALGFLAIMQAAKAALFLLNLCILRLLHLKLHS